MAAHVGLPVWRPAGRAVHGGLGAVMKETSPEMIAKAKRMLNLMCALDGMNFQALRDELDWSDHEVQACLRYLNTLGYVSARPLPSLEVRYSVTGLGWSASELVASLDKSE